MIHANMYVEDKPVHFTVFAGRDSSNAIGRYSSPHVLRRSDGSSNFAMPTRTVFWTRQSLMSSKYVLLQGSTIIESYDKPFHHHSENALTLHFNYRSWRVSKLWCRSMRKVVFETMG